MEMRSLDFEEFLWAKDYSDKGIFNRPINPGRQTRGNLSTPPFVSIPLLPSARVNAK